MPSTIAATRSPGSVPTSAQPSTSTPRSRAGRAAQDDSSSQSSSDASGGDDDSDDDDDDDGEDDGDDDDDDQDQDQDQDGEEEDDNPSIVSETTDASDLYTDSETGSEGEEDDEDDESQDESQPTSAQQVKRRAAPTSKEYVGPRFALSNAGPREWQEQAAATRMEGPRPDDGDEEEASDDEQEVGDATQREDEVQDADLSRLIGAIQDESSTGPARHMQWEDDEEDLEEAAEARRRLHEEDAAAELREYAFQGELRAVQGFHSQKARPGAPRRRARPVELLSPDVQNYLREANTCYVDGNAREAIDHLEKAIRIEPHIRAAWSTLAICWADLGMEEKSIQASMVHAHLTRNALTLWVELADRSRALGLYAQATYCYTQAIKCSRFKDRHDVIDLMWEKAMVCLEHEQARMAYTTLFQILKLRPHNQEVIRQLIPPLLALGQLDRAIEVLEESAAFNMERLADPNVDPALLMEQAESEGEPMDWVRNTFEASEVVTLADLYLLVEEPAKALNTIRRCARWLQGRGDQDFWDDVTEDDREFDESRDVKLPDGSYRQGDFGRRIDMAPPNGLDPQMRLRLGRARAKLGYQNEAKYHFTLFTQDTHPLEQLENFYEIVDEYLRLHMYPDALDILAQMLDHDDLHDAETFDRAAAALQGLGRSEEAKTYLENLAESLPGNLDYKLRLAEVCEDLGERQRAIELVNEVVHIRQQMQAQEQQGATGVDGEALASATQLSSFFDESVPEPRSTGARRSDWSTLKRRDRFGRTREERERVEQRLDEDAQLSWRRLKQREPDVFIDGWWLMSVELDGTPNKIPYGCTRKESLEQRQHRFVATQDWLEQAIKIVDEFRRQQLFFPKERTKKFKGILTRHTRRGKKAANVDSQASAMMSRLSGNMVGDEEPPSREATSFRKIHFDDWVDLFMKLSFVMTKVGEYREAQDMLKHVSNSNVVVPYKERSKALKLASVACALYVRDFGLVFEQIRWLSTTWQFHGNPTRIISTLANYMGYYAMGDFMHPNHSKAYLRRARLHEAIVAGRPKRFSSTTNRWSAVDKLSKRVANAEASRSASDFKYSTGRRGTRSASNDGTEGGAMSDVGDSVDEEEDAAAEDEHDDRPAHLRSLKNASKPPPNMDEVERQGLEMYQALPPHERDRCALPTKHPIVAEALYGNTLVTAQSGQSSMGYWFRLFAHQQNDALICLCAAVSCFARAQNRQVDNRNHVVLQGFSMLALYRKLRGQDSMEAEYNFGRALHMLGLTSQAQKHYEKVLEMRQQEIDKASQGDDTDEAEVMMPVDDDVEDGNGRRRLGFRPWREAAFNLSIIYILSGNALMSRSLYQKWLAV